VVIAATVANSRLGFFFGRSVAGRLRLGEIPPAAGVHVQHEQSGGERQQEG